MTEKGTQVNLYKVNRVIAWLVLFAGIWLVKMAIAITQTEGSVIDFAVVTFAAIVLIRESVEELRWKP